jgi:hypothetical protein
LLGVNVSEAPALTVRPEFPEARVTLTVTLAAGAADSDTPNTSLVPCATANALGATSSFPAAATVVA